MVIRIKAAVLMAVRNRRLRWLINPSAEAVAVVVAMTVVAPAIVEIPDRIVITVGRRPRKAINPMPHRIRSSSYAIPKKS
jgi:hypothetical protein